MDDFLNQAWVALSSETSVIIFLNLFLLVAVAFLARVFRKRSRHANPWGKAPYGLQENFLSPAEKKFYFSMREVLGNSATICPKPAVRELLCVTKQAGNNQQMYFNWISQKHVDFALCDNESMEVICAVELDDSSHQRRDRVQRDQFMDKAFNNAGLPLIHVPWRPNYGREDFKEILPLFSLSPAQARPKPSTAKNFKNEPPPTCPKCGAEMVLRVAGKGENKGQEFYGCSNFPDCRGTLKKVEIYYD